MDCPTKSGNNVSGKGDGETVHRRTAGFQNRRRANTLRGNAARREGVWINVGPNGLKIQKK
jgi:hypothetical protein